MRTLHRIGPDIPALILQAAASMLKAGSCSKIEPAFKVIEYGGLEYTRYTGARRTIDEWDVKTWAKEYRHTEEDLNKARALFE